MKSKRQPLAPQEMERLAIKLAEFSKSLSDNERSLLAHMLDRGDTKLRPSQPFTDAGYVFQSPPPELNPGFFTALCW
jgi:hypothetical protein